MSPAYLAAFGFESVSFSKEVADADLWLASSKEALVDELHEAVAERSSVILVGEPGVGKTCVLRALRHHPVFLLDEAHLLHQDTLDSLHILLNYNWDSKALLSVVLSVYPSWTTGSRCVGIARCTRASAEG